MRRQEPGHVEGAQGPVRQPLRLLGFRQVNIQRADHAKHVHQGNEDGNHHYAVDRLRDRRGDQADPLQGSNIDLVVGPGRELEGHRRPSAVVQHGRGGVHAHLNRRVPH